MLVDIVLSVYHSLHTHAKVDNKHKTEQNPDWPDNTAGMSQRFGLKFDYIQINWDKCVTFLDQFSVYFDSMSLKNP